MDLTYPVFRRLEGGGQAFNIPYAYLSYRPTPERVNCYSEREGFEVAFWMPTLVPSMKEAFYANGWPPGELDPPDGSYLVVIPYVRVIPDGKNTPGFPFSSIEFEMDMYRERIPFESALTRITPLDFWLQTYVNVEEEAILECLSLSDGFDFTFYYRDLKLAVQGSLSKDKLSQWRAVKDGARTLLERWMVR